MCLPSLWTLTPAVTLLTLFSHIVVLTTHHPLITGIFHPPSHPLPRSNMTSLLLALALLPMLCIVSVHARCLVSTSSVAWDSDHGCYRFGVHHTCAGPYTLSAVTADFTSKSLVPTISLAPNDNYASFCFYPWTGTAVTAIDFAGMSFTDVTNVQAPVDWVNTDQLDHFVGTWSGGPDSNNAMVFRDGDGKSVQIHYMGVTVSGYYMDPTKISNPGDPTGLGVTVCVMTTYSPNLTAQPDVSLCDKFAWLDSYESYSTLFMYPPSDITESIQFTTNSGVTQFYSGQVSA
jgi:hypothetical protein